VRSAAIPRRLGFVEEGQLRNLLSAHDGRLRTMIIFSLIPGEWQKEH